MLQAERRVFCTDIKPKYYQRWFGCHTCVNTLKVGVLIYLHVGTHVNDAYLMNCTLIRPSHLFLHGVLQCHLQLALLFEFSSSQRISWDDKFIK